jgi:hypothetical protein
MGGALAGLGLPALAAADQTASAPVSLPVWRDLFNGKDLTGWVDVNTSPSTWSVRDGMLICTGKPIGVMRTDRMYENFIIHVEWMHLEAGGNSGMFLWSSAVPRGNLPNGIEIQMLELDYVNQGRPGGNPRPIAYVHGETWGVGDVSAVADNPSPNKGRSAALENRALGRGNWNTYIVMAVDGVIKMSVNGKFVNGLSQSSQKKGYICMESEGAEIHFRHLKIMELPPGVTSAEQTAKPL